MKITEINVIEMACPDTWEMAISDKVVVNGVQFLIIKLLRICKGENKGFYSHSEISSSKLLIPCLFSAFCNDKLCDIAVRRISVEISLYVTVTDMQLVQFWCYK